MSDYYRGSSSYEETVKNQLNALEATGRAIRKMDSGVKNEIQTATDAINANTNAIQDMAMEIRSDIRESTYVLVASQAMLAKTLNQGFNTLDDTLNLGFSMMNSKMDIVADRVCAKLDEIHDIVNNPLLTQSRELFRRALNNYNRGYYEEALEDCKAAVEKNKTDFISWDLLGHIYMFGAGKFSNVVDVDKAEDAFFNAAKYIDYDLGKSDEANTLGSEIYYYLGYAHLIKSNDLLIEKKKKESIKKLQEAEKASSEAYRLSNKNLIAMYEHAKELHFLDKNEEALQLIEKLIQNDKKYALIAATDKNFKSLWNEIEALVEKLKNDLCRLIREVLEEVVTKYEAKISTDKANGDKLVKYFEEPLRETIASVIEKYKSLKIETMDYFSVLDLQNKVYEDLKKLQKDIEEIISDAQYKKWAEEDAKRKEQEEKKRVEDNRRREREKNQALEEEKKQKKKEKRTSFISLSFIILIAFLIVRGCSSYLHGEIHQTKLLFKAIKSDNVNNAKTYIKSGANVNRNVNGYTPLIFAVKNGQTEMIDFLIKSGADVHGSDKYGRQAIHWIMRGTGINEKTNRAIERMNILCILIQSGADVNARDNYDMSPLMYGVNSYDHANNTILLEKMETIRIQCIEKLIESGANVNANYQDYISPEFQNRKKNN